MENKYVELEKLNNLKECGTITQEEFEIEKYRILNSNIHKPTSKKVKSKIFFILSSIGIVTCIILGIFYYLWQSTLWFDFWSENNNDMSAVDTISNILICSLVLLGISTIVLLVLAIILKIKEKEESKLSIKIKKNVIKFVVIIILLIILTIGGIFLSQFISANSKIKVAKENLQQIKVEELEEKIIKELEKSELNINTSNGNQVVMTQFTDNKDEFVTAIITITNRNNIYNGEGVAIPCFKIESDKNGNFKNITYLENGYLENVVSEVIRNVFKNEYNVDIIIDGNSRYNGNFRRAADTQEVTKTSDDFWNVIYKRITDREPIETTLYTITFGLDFSK